MTAIDNAIQPSNNEVLDHEQQIQNRRKNIFSEEFWAIVKHVVFPFIALRLFLVVIGIVTLFYIEPLVDANQPIHLEGAKTSWPHILWTMWDRFDSGFYLNIAIGGYWGADTLDGMSNWVFFPLYPLLIRIFTFPFTLFGFSDSAEYQIYRIVGVVLSNISALVALIYLYKLAVREFDRLVAGRTVLYLMLYPFAFYLSAIYTEALFLMLSIGCFYYARTRRWWLAGLFGGLAALTRSQGVLMAVVIGWEYWQSLADRYAPVEYEGRNIVVRVREWVRSHIVGLWRSLASWRTWPGFLPMFLPPIGLGLFFIYAKLQVGTFFAFHLAEEHGWQRSLTNPLKVLKDTFEQPLPPPSPWDWTFHVVNRSVVVIFFLALIPIFLRLPLVYGIISLLMVVLPIASGHLNAIARYYLEIFPAFMILAWFVSKKCGSQHEWVHNMVVSSLAVLLGLAMVMWTLGIYAMH